jgi:hypothetical protein
MADSHLSRTRIGSLKCGRAPRADISSVCASASRWLVPGTLRLDRRRGPCAWREDWIARVYDAGRRSQRGVRVVNQGHEVIFEPLSCLWCVGC